ncbi:MAG TPA: hypothetical protein VGC91_16875 [Pyrinomonadaceae bacterium]|jgi:hypothetical protein
MSKMKEKTPNPEGKHGKPITLAPMTFDEAVRKILAAPPEPKSAKEKPTKKRADKKQ